jgi:hypothetical protein
MTNQSAAVPSPAGLAEGEEVGIPYGQLAADDGEDLPVDYLAAIRREERHVVGDVAQLGEERVEVAQLQDLFADL